jgi:hypothetical protein
MSFAPSELPSFAPKQMGFAPSELPSFAPKHMTELI